MMAVVRLNLHAGYITKQCQVLHSEVDQAIGWTFILLTGQGIISKRPCKQHAL